LSLFGLKLAWQNRNWSWAKLILVWSGVYLVVVSSMMTKLPWYILPIYPALALAAGVALAEVKSFPSYRSYPYSWAVFFGLLGLAIIGGGIYITFGVNEDRSLLIILGLMSLTTIVTSLMIAKRDEQFIMVLFWGMYVGLALFFASDYWLWELNEAYPVKPVAAIIKAHVPPHQTVHTSFAYERPSLNFYSERQVIPASREELKQLWQAQEKPYLLVERETFEELNLKDINFQVATEDFLLLQ
jgi:4-amino-4-deoxy-L-arabinose transferase-like glycosyltransferase